MGETQNTRDSEENSLLLLLFPVKEIKQNMNALK